MQRGKSKVIDIIAVLMVTGLFSSCLNQQVDSSVDLHARSEGERFAAEVRDQSPFTAVEMSWKEADSLMRERNLAYRAALDDYREANKEIPISRQLSKQLKSSISFSVKGVLKPQSLIKSLQDPVTNLPKQLKSLAALKDISHDMERTVWNKTADSLTAEMAIRRERIKLHRLLRLGELIDQELDNLERAVGPESELEPKLLAAKIKWRKSIENQRETWLSEVRDLFNAEYYDVHFCRDQSGFPDYRNVSAPQLGNWQRWGALGRSHSLVLALKGAHNERKPAVPGTMMVKNKLEGLMKVDTSGRVQLEAKELRGGVRQLIRNWREMKKCQRDASEIERSKSSKYGSLAQLAQAQKLFDLRKREIKAASVVWLMDEQCWDD